MLLFTTQLQNSTPCIVYLSGAFLLQILCRLIFFAVHIFILQFSCNDKMTKKNIVWAFCLISVCEDLLPKSPVKRERRPNHQYFSVSKFCRYLIVFLGRRKFIIKPLINTCKKWWVIVDSIHSFTIMQCCGAGAKVVSCDLKVKTNGYSLNSFS